MRTACSHLANSPLISQVTYRSNTTTRMTTAKTYDYLNRLQNITSTPGASGESAVSFNYAYNDANQRTRVNLDDGSFWIYEYDKLGQVVSGKRYWSDWTPVAGQQYEYAFDDIGNRTSTKAGGDDAGGALRSASYTANSLNQYSSRDVPAYLNVLGIANANASVTVNSQSPYRKGEYFWKELAPNNTSAAVWQAVTNIASLTGTNQTNTGNLFLPKTAEAYAYDLDGNLTSDGRWTNKWDAENRLVDMTSHSSGPSGSRKSLQFAYDSQGRRYSKVVSNWTGSAWTRVLHERFLYDGWNLLGAFNGTNAAIIRSFLWGLDLSGSMQGAGGVGGLLFFTHHSTPQPSTHCAAYDGNGNVMALVDGKTGSTSARYEYDPFGQTIRASGTMATVNPVRFSSKVVDDETDYAYYGYRYLNPNAGRWLSRDPVEEAGAFNLNSFAANDGGNQVDPLGLSYLSVYQNHQISPGEKVKGYTIGGGVWGKTLMSLRIGNIVTEVPDKCTCCLRNFDVILEVDTLNPVVNSGWFRDFRGSFLADADFATEVSDHEAVHAAAGLYMGSELGGKLVSDCGGHCWKSALCHRATWTKESCQQYAESELRGAGEWIKQQITRVALQEWDARVRGHGIVSRTSRYTSELEPAFREYYQTETARLKNRKFCPIDVCFPGYGDM